MKKKYQAPRIIEEHSCEAQALGCPKIPGLGDPNFCGQVWISLHGVSTAGCSMSSETRSS